MAPKITDAAVARARAFVAAKVEAERPESVRELAEAERTLTRLERERTREPDPARRVTLLPGVDAAEADLVRLPDLGLWVDDTGLEPILTAHDQGQIP